MRNVLILTSKELKSYFVSPVAYVILGAYMVGAALFFYGSLQDPSPFGVPEANLVMQRVFGTLSFILLLLSPLLTMRLLAEEQRTGTIEILLTGPLRDIELVLGKYLFSLIFLIVMLGLTLYYPLLISQFGEPDPGPVYAGYLGLFLFGATFMSIGLLMSSLTQNQIIAAVLTFITLLILWFIESAAGFFGGTGAEVLQYVSLTRHTADFVKGVIGSKDIIYFLSLVAAGLFLTTRSLETRRWR